jgi:ribonuclease P protein component
MDGRPPAAAFERLRRRAEFVRVAAGRRAHGALFTLQVGAGVPDGPPRFGLTVTRKSGTATERNRIRRRLRAALGSVAPLAARAGHDYVIVARRAVLDARYDHLLAELAAIFRRAHAAKGGRPPPRSGRRAAPLTERADDVG